MLLGSPVGIWEGTGGAAGCSWGWRVLDLGEAAAVALGVSPMSAGHAVWLSALLPQDTELLDLRETIDFLKKKNSEAQAVIQGALNGTDVTPKGKAWCCSPLPQGYSPSWATHPHPGLPLPGTGTGPQGASRSREVFTQETEAPGQQFFPAWDPHIPVARGRQSKLSLQEV